MLSANTFTRFACLLILGLMSACGSGGDTTLPIDSQETVEASLSSDDPANDNAANDNAEESGGESVAVEVDPIQPEPESDQVESDAVQSDNSSESSTELADPQNDNEQTNTDSQLQPTNPDVEVANDSSVSNAQPASDQQVNFSNAKLLIDLVPNGGSYPANFHHAGDKLYYWTVDTDPIFASCSWHWGSLDEDDKSISINLVASHPETGEVSLNKKIMTLGDFAEDPNDACAGYNGSIMQVFEQAWTPSSASGEQQFVVQFHSRDLGPDQVWTTDGTEANTRLLETGQLGEQTIFEGNKVFFAGADGLSVSDSFSGDRRKLFEGDNNFHYGNIRQIVKSAAREATFEIKVEWNRFQIWTYDLDTDDWTKKFNIKPDSNVYDHHKTLLVDGQTLISLGQTRVDYESALGLSSAFGDVTSFDIISESAPTISNTERLGRNYLSNENNNDRFFYSTDDSAYEPDVTTIWGYREERIKNLFSITEPGLRDRRVIVGHDGHIYVTGTRKVREWPETSNSLELWSFDLQTEQVVKLSNDDWYSTISGFSSRDESYIFRYLNTPDGLIFINLKEDSGRELWFTDGTLEGTRQLTDINPGIGNSDPQNFYYSGDAIYFSADDGTHGREPWMIGISR